jgi:hypothetical protein
MIAKTAISGTTEVRKEESMGLSGIRFGTGTAKVPGAISAGTIAARAPFATVIDQRVSW